MHWLSEVQNGEHTATVPPERSMLMQRLPGVQLVMLVHAVPGALAPAVEHERAPVPSM
jgi:hypothetical protein